MARKKVGVLISGNGSNLQALIDACARDDYPADISVVISNREDAYGVNRAVEAGIAAHIVNHKDYPSREAFDQALDSLLRHHQVDIICLAGFMRLLSPGFVDAWKGRMLNIHPSLLPKYKGARAVADALAAGETITGCTVHLVIPEVDAGPVVLQAEVPILAGDSEELLHKRIHEQEHRIYPEALKHLIEQVG